MDRTGHELVSPWALLVMACACHLPALSLASWPYAGLGFCWPGLAMFWARKGLGKT